MELEMEPQVTVMIATKMEEAMTKLDEAIEYMRENVDSKERAPLLRAIGEIYGIMTDKIKSRLVISNPELHEVLFRGLPRNAPHDFLRMSQLRDSADREE